MFRKHMKLCDIWVTCFKKKKPQTYDYGHFHMFCKHMKLCNIWVKSFKKKKHQTYDYGQICMFANIWKCTTYESHVSKRKKLKHMIYRSFSYVWKSLEFCRKIPGLYSKSLENQNEYSRLSWLSIMQKKHIKLRIILGFLRFGSFLESIWIMESNISAGSALDVVLPHTTKNCNLGLSCVFSCCTYTVQKADHSNTTQLRLTHFSHKTIASLHIIL